jgi:prephenate dehydratase
MSHDPKNTIAFQGVEGANSDLACRQAQPYMHTKPYASFDDVFEAVEAGEAALGMIPIENSQAGRVAEIHNILPKSNLHIVGEYFQPVEHYLVVPKGASFETVKDVYSHPQALMQCREYLREHTFTGHSYSNTAKAAQDVAEWPDPSKAAIASRLAAELYGLEALGENIQDADDNMTVFIQLAREPADPNPKDGTTLTTLLFTNGVNIIKLESYIPGGISSAAQFFLTFEGNPQTRNVQLAIEELGFFCSKVQVLGVYLADERRKQG